VLSNWWDAYPTVKSSPSLVTAEEVVALKKDPASSAEFAVIDVRRNDHAVRIFHAPGVLQFESLS
jgi:arsenite methyltransferase